MLFQYYGNRWASIANVFHEQNIEQQQEEEEEEMDGLTIPPNHEIGSSRKSVRRERSRKEIRSRIQIFEVVLVDLYDFIFSC